MGTLKVLYLDNLKRMISKRRKYFVLMMIAPILMLLIFSVVFGSGNSNGIKVGVIQGSNNLTTKAILKSLEGNSSITVTNISENEVTKDFNNKTIDLVLIIPNNVEQNILNNKDSGISIKTTGNDSDYNSIEPIINNTIINLKYIASAANGNEKTYNIAVNNYLNKSVSVKESTLATTVKNYNGVSEFLGLLIFFIFAMAIAGTKIIGDARKNNVYSRVFMAPVSKLDYFLANILSSLTVLAIQIAIALLSIKYIVKLNLGLSNLELTIVLLVIGAFAISLELLSMLLSKDDTAMLSNIIVWMLAMLGGLFVPIEIFPKFINNISMFLPTRWAMQYIYNLQQGISFMSSVKYIIGILIVTIIFLIIAAIVAMRETITFKDI